MSDRPKLPLTLIVLLIVFTVPLILIWLEPSPADRDKELRDLNRWHEQNEREKFRKSLNEAAGRGNPNYRSRP